jgi:hypothetical protein
MRIRVNQFFYERHAFWVDGPDSEEAFTMMKEWCEDRHGPMGDLWICDSINRIVFLTHDSDAMEFKLRWV